MTADKQTVVFVAFQEQPNLGVGYLGSVLVKAGYRIQILDFQLEREEILTSILECNPILVGFSVIFQYHIEKFNSLITYLRKQGVECHFTCGGHYPSLRPNLLFNAIPLMDSITLFEGEHTCLELVQKLEKNQNWKTIDGIAYSESKGLVRNPLRPLEENLDTFPPPLRPPLKEFVAGRKYATILAGRGCVYNCSFCSIRQFYSAPPGSIKRVRQPEMVVREIELLHQQKDCSIFMFQDDDFPVAKPHGPTWAIDFCKLLREKNLAEKINWKINCRPDEIDPDLFTEMKQCGLFLVYLGIESGIDEGLTYMNKRVNTSTVHKAVNTLKDLDIIYDYGFMLFDPTTTFDAISRNLDFLEAIIADGSSPINFGKMRPYAETRIETELKAQGRLKGRQGFEDYRFIDEPVNDLYHTVIEAMEEWIGSNSGITNVAKWTRYCQYLRDNNFSENLEDTDLKEQTTAIIAKSNRFAINLIRELSNGYQHQTLSPTKAREICLEAHGVQSHYSSQLHEILSSLQSQP
ncbi:B12-binding domain-containing radical SAM protein [Desulfosediminicola flagellatus]|uniref:B12-binding domain-containing radical SAM protein n=1 Tax=Desulfosediminicola flagellatus TaxID=2569541 RepID=UPI0010AD6D88|nr:radical SAM protein [Desulfosediminicola flagellatus]